MVSVAKGDITVGLDVGAHEYEIAPELVRDYAAALDDQHPWYTGDSPFGGPVAPALILHSEVYRFGGWYLANLYGNLHARQEWDLFAPIAVGERVTTHSTIIDRYIKRGRDYVVNEVQILGSASGRLLSRGRTYQSFLLDESRQEPAVDKQREKSTKRRFEVGEGEFEEEIEPLEKTVTLEMCKRYSPGTNYHNDVEEAKKLGFPDIVVQGMMTVCFLSELMTHRFGEGWFAGGRMSVNLVNVLWGADGGVTCRGVVREFTPEGARRRAHCEIWAEKADGTKVIVGSASAVV
ncbi:MAG: MaoC family dehydratase N-terminal domain-containing protein [Chloroflexi bacterium]|nr:MaoC family dehydratase N-terminal domain-containing protein [Chloroflexota bacterium]